MPSNNIILFLIASLSLLSADLLAKSAYNDPINTKHKVAPTPLRTLPNPVAKLGLASIDTTSNSNNLPPEILGLWMQSEQAPLEGAGQNCGCRWFGLSFGPPKRCYFYFTATKVVSGYLRRPRGISAEDCKNPPQLSTKDKSKLLQQISNLAVTKHSGASSIKAKFTYAVGDANITQEDAEVKVQDRITQGTYVDFIYTLPLITGHRRICSSYIVRGSTLYLASDPKGGSKTQSADVAICDSQRFTQLIKYTKIENPGEN